MADLKEFSCFGVVELENDCGIRKLEKLGDFEGQMGEINSGEPPNIVDSSRDKRR